MTLFLFIFVLLLLNIVKGEIIAVDSENYTETFLDDELRFFKESMGIVVLSDPPEACEPISGPPTNLHNKSIPCFVLIEGSLCSMEEKVKNAWLANYSAALLYNVGAKGAFIWEDRTFMLKMFGFYNITSVLITTNSAERIMDNFLYTVDPGSRIFLLMNHPNIISLLLVFAFVAGIFILLMLFFLMIKCIQRTRQQRRYRLSARHLKQLMTVKYKTGDPYDTCAICLEDYKEKDRLRILPCAHAYHCKCIDPWLTDNRRTCPICKQKVRLAGVHDDEEDTDSDTNGRAETAPLIRVARQQVDHGTFTTHVPISVQSTSQAIRVGSGEATSKDIPSDALDDGDASEDGDLSSLRQSTSAPDVLMVGQFPVYGEKRESQNVAYVECSNEIREDNDLNYSSDGNDDTKPLMDKTYVI